jgi:putative flippase GtrA
MRDAFLRRIGSLLRDQRVRFLIVGGINTVVGYALFAAFELLFNGRVSYFVSLYLSYALAAILAFVLHRNYTFQVNRTGNVVIDFFRFQAVGLVALAFNTVALPLLVEGVGWDPLVAQGVVVVVTVLISYVGHKYISFRRSS